MTKKMFGNSIKKQFKKNRGFVQNLAFHTDVKNIQDHYDAFFILEKKQEIIGMGGLKTHTPTKIEIKRLQINIDYQGQGLGKKLLTHMIQYATDTGAKEIILDVSDPQKKARALYQSFGFSTTHTETNFLGPDKEAFHQTYMKKKIK